MSAIARSRFYPVIAFAFAAVAIVGFSRTYYLRFLSDLPPLDTLMQLHGAVFTAWLLVFIVQTRLVAARRVDLHMKLGIASVVLAVVIVLVGFASAAVKANIPRVHPSGLSPAQFTIVGMMSLALFTAFITLGIAFRRRSALHKRFMVLATISVLTPAASRLLTLMGLREHWAYLVPIVPALFVVWCLVQDWRRHRIVHPVYAIGGVVVVAAWPLRLMIGPTEWWTHVGEGIARIGAGL